VAFTSTADALLVSSAPIEQIGDIAGAAGITLHELAGQRGSLEEAFMQLTGDSVEYSGGSTAAELHTMAPAAAPGGPPLPSTPPSTPTAGA
jgi:ABC-2 type transport system ATP-binding protein